MCYIGCARCALPVRDRNSFLCIWNSIYGDLQTYVRGFSADRALTQLSRRIIAVSPCQVKLHHVKWTISFKSTQIAMMVAISMQSAEERQLRETYDLIYKTPASSCMAGWMFEGFVHRVFSAGWRSDEPPPQPTPMASDGYNPPTFSTDPPPPLAQAPLYPTAGTHQP